MSAVKPLPLIGAAVNALALPAPRLAGVLTRRMWAAPGPPRSIPEEDRALHESADTATIRVGAWDVTTYAWGDTTRPVLLAHGWRSRSLRFAPLIRRLVDLGYGPVSWDAPGHGATPGPVGTILDALRIQRLLQERHGRFHAVVAHSMGVPFAVHALREGVEADRVVLLSGVSDFDYLLTAFSDALRLGPRAREALRTEVERHYFEADPTVWERFSTTHRIDTLGRPFLLLHDDTDEVVPFAHSLRTLEHLGARGRMIATTGLGHSGALAVGEHLDAITSFVQGTDLPAHALGR
ncbi:alpha/beta hydrolase [Nocardiopsis lambiniae]|uniref:Alpha/beta fold hydrolase n=1 Tax=Nocardiopsis lambiniae TaxID=3075539 RepID=A0ABU2MAH5_9ACTN|nr:alpha/beta fold hydrolase [Nocardiopsis sp. DSM 44743]MDT0329590.1 alpha/beta fold hydrolase [Nocardiopsis sp. DSM 44743]